jgi:hypothetical protein
MERREPCFKINTMHEGIWVNQDLPPFTQPPPQPSPQGGGNQSGFWKGMHQEAKRVFRLFIIS